MPTMPLVEIQKRKLSLMMASERLGFREGEVEAVVTFLEESSWEAMLADLQQARTILLLGATDTGKTTFLRWLANTLRAQGQRIAIVDADVGQSSVGPPTTIGLGLVGQPFQSLQELTPAALYFVGSTSPQGHFMPVVVGTKHMVDRAQRIEVDQVIVDTCGFIGADGGQALKHYQIDLVNPDVVVCLQRADECEPILLAFRSCQRPRILRLRASHACRRRDREERRVYRERALHRYFAKPKIVMLSWDDLNLIEAPIGAGVAVDAKRDSPHGLLRMPEILWAEQREGELHVVLRARLSSDAVAELERAAEMPIRIWLAEELHGTLLGLLDEAGEALGIGILQHLHIVHHRIEVLTVEGIEGILGIQWSRTRMGPGGELRRVPSTM
jgi:polynucleotide 5'-hydroxyl-kinase GRC3/NOL9